MVINLKDVIVYGNAGHGIVINGVNAEEMTPEQRKATSVYIDGVTIDGKILTDNVMEGDFIRNTDTCEEVVVTGVVETSYKELQGRE